MAEISSPEEYFTRVIPEQYAAAMTGAPENVVDQPELTAIYEIAGDAGGIYGLRSSGGRVDVLSSEQIASPDIRVTMSLNDWRTFAASGATDPFIDYIQRRKVGVVQGLKGMVRLELTRSDGSDWQSTTIFGGQEEPAVTLQMTSDDYRAMLSGELNGQMAFMTGKLKFEGSLPLLMQIGALSS